MMTIKLSLLIEKKNMRCPENQQYISNLHYWSMQTQHVHVESKKKKTETGIEFMTELLRRLWYHTGQSLAQEI